MLFLPGQLPALLRPSFLSSWPSLPLFSSVSLLTHMRPPYKIWQRSPCLPKLYCLGSIVELQDCRVGSYLHSDWDTVRHSRMLRWSQKDDVWQDVSTLCAIISWPIVWISHYLHSPCTTKFFPSWAKTPHQTFVWLVGILCRATETSLQQLYAGHVHICRLDCINHVIRQGIMVSIGIFNISFRFLALTLRLSTLLWCGLLSVEFHVRSVKNPSPRRDVVTPAKVLLQPPQWSDSHILYLVLEMILNNIKEKNLKILKFIFSLNSGGCLKIEVMKPPIKARRVNLSIWEPSAEDAHSKLTVGVV